MTPALARGAVLLLGGALFLGASCAGPPRPGPAAVPRGATGEPEVVLAGVPFLPPEEDSCGPSSLAMLLLHHGIPAPVRDLVRETRTTGLRGTLATDLAAAARRRGLDASVESLSLDGLKAEIAAGRPVVLLVDLGGWIVSRPHYVLAYGYTEEGVVAHSGSREGALIPYAEFRRQWDRAGRLAVVARRRGP